MAEKELQENKKAKRKDNNKEEKRRFRRVRETWSELKKVSWPNFPTIAKNTGIVLGIVVLFLIVLFAFDFILMMGYYPLTGQGWPWTQNSEAVTAIFRAAVGGGTLWL